MKVLLIGGTGTISMAISERLIKEGHELWLVNRGNRNHGLPEGVHMIRGEIQDEDSMAEKLGNQQFDVIADFIAFTPKDVERDFRLFRERTKQYILVSSASAYQKPSSDYRINEGTPLANPYWEYSRNKIACEETLMRFYREEGFPATVVRPSHTYSERSVPVGIHGKQGSYQVLKRMQEGKKVLIHGDGMSLWTMTFSSDFAKAFTGLMGNIHAIGEAVQITSEETLTWNQIYKAIADVLGTELRACHVSSEFLASCCPPDLDLRGGLLGDKANSVVFDNSRLKRLVPGFTASVRFDQGVRRAVEYVLSHGECRREDPEFDAWCDRVVAAQEEAAENVRRWLQMGNAHRQGDMKKIM